MYGNNDFFDVIRLARGCSSIDCTEVASLDIFRREVRDSDSPVRCAYEGLDRERRDKAKQIVRVSERIAIG